MAEERVFIETYGCQMNVYDTELVKSILNKSGYELVPEEKAADWVMMNTCSVREKANLKIYNRVHEIRQARANPNDVKIALLGCMVTNLKTELLEDKNLHIDLIAGPDSYKKLPTLMRDLNQTGDASFDVNLSEFETYEDVYPTRGEGVNAWIAIMRGCNNYCTFCVVPFTRGRERSRSPESVVDEVKRLVDEGYQQVTLLGQNVNSYAHEDAKFVDLMDKVSQVEGIKRIRFTSPHPKDFPTDLLQLMRDRDNICKQIHLPLQAGNTRVLEKMNRTYSKEEFLDLAAEMREIIPGLSLSTDIIIGFPTETAEEFQDTVDVVQDVQFDSAYIFKYSERKGTTASRRFPDDVSADEKKRRITELNTIQKQISLNKNQEKIGQKQLVLVEEKGTKKDPHQLSARNDANQIVILDGIEAPFKVGDWVNTEITGASANVLIGKALQS